MRPAVAPPNPHAAGPPAANPAQAQAGAGAPAAGAAGGQSVKNEAGASSSSSAAAASKSAAALSSAPWKGDSEETQKTRKNALRVIVTKFRNFWPAEDDPKLTARATLLEKGVYDVTHSKADYISRLQRDLNCLSAKKEVERKQSKAILQTSGDMHASSEAAEKGKPYWTADAKAKYVQKIYAMDRKYQQIFAFLKHPDERFAKTSEQQIKPHVNNFKNLARLKEIGPFDLDALNHNDDQLEKCRQAIMSRQRVSSQPNRESVDKQNDRTRQMGARMLDKLKRLNKDRPLVVTELSWVMENDLPTLIDPPELVAMSAANKRSGNNLQSTTAKKLKANRMDDESIVPAPDIGDSSGPGEILRIVCPFRSAGGDCVPSVRESHLEAPALPPPSRLKGYVDFDIPNDAETQDPFVPAEAQVLMPLSLEPALEQLRGVALTLIDDFFEPSKPLEEEGVSEPGTRVEHLYQFRQKGMTWSADGEMTTHTVTLKILRNAFWEDYLPWHSRVVCLRRLPIEVQTSPDSLLQLEPLCAEVAKGKTLDPGQWLQEVMKGVTNHLNCLSYIWEELREIKAEHSDYLQVKPLEKCPPSMAGFKADFSCLPAGEVIDVQLSLTIPLSYPVEEPMYSLLGLPDGLSSGAKFKRRFTEILSSVPSPRGIKNMVEAYLVACSESLEDTFQVSRVLPNGAM